jgi:murein DD-endopeptidase MepM/ murein hydrolase activator NlpD
VLLRSNHSHPLRRSLAPALRRVRWQGAGAAALLCSGVAWASLPHMRDSNFEHREWQALGIAPLSSGAATGVRMAPTDAVEPIDVAPKRAIAQSEPEPEAPKENSVAPLRIRGRIGDGFYWSLRAAGASPQAAAQYLAALATEIDVGGDVAMGDSFDLVLGAGKDRPLLYAGLDRAVSPDLQLVRWTANGRSEWIDAANAARPTPVASGMMWPVAGRITSYFGNRYHPILHFMRFHAGLDFGASWGSPIVAAADGQVVRAGWAGGYGRQVRLAHGGGLTTSYSHMSQIVAEPGTIVHAGQLIGYVGSSGLSTGPHLHYEVQRQGVPVNPLSVRFASVQLVDNGVANAVKARLKALLGVGVKRGNSATTIGTGGLADFRPSPAPRLRLGKNARDSAAFNAH